MAAKRGYGDPGVEALRERVALRVRETSVRHVASEVGMSVSGLHDFLYTPARRSPHERTYHKLLTWYRTQYIGGKPGRGSEISAGMAEAALGVLFDHLPVSDRQKALDRFVAMMNEVSAEKRPRWLTRLERELKRLR